MAFYADAECQLKLLQQFIYLFLRRVSSQTLFKLCCRRNVKQFYYNNYEH